MGEARQPWGNKPNGLTVQYKVLEEGLPKELVPPQDPHARSPHGPRFLREMPGLPRRMAENGENPRGRESLDLPFVRARATRAMFHVKH